MIVIVIVTLPPKEKERSHRQGRRKLPSGPLLMSENESGLKHKETAVLKNR